MKKLKYFFFFAFFFSFVLSVSAMELEIKSEHAILINLDENKILYEKNSEEETPMASLTKLMTAVVVVESVNLDEVVMINQSDFKGLWESNAAVAGFRVGQKVTIRDLLYGLLLPSGADAANALTRIAAENTESFVHRMNEKAASLGLTHTHFVNATGLDTINHYSTAKEMAILFQYALQNPDLRQILTTEKYTMSDSSFSVFSTVKRRTNQNNLDYILGGKTGTTENAGLCLASMASFNNSNYLLVTIKAPQEGKNLNHFYDAKTIYEYFMKHYESQILLKEGEKILSLYPEYTKEEQVIITLKEPIIKYVIKNFDPKDIQIKYQEKNELRANTKPGTELGEVKISYQNEIIKEFPILLETNLHFDIGKYFQKNWPSFLLLLLLFLLLFYRIFMRKKKRKYRKKK